MKKFSKEDFFCMIFLILKSEKLKKIRKPQKKSWNDNFENLHVFRETYGHTNVPQRFFADVNLGAWVGKQRWRFSKLKLSQEQIYFLRYLDFDWAPGKDFYCSATWHKRYQELISFRRIHGHVNVPCNYENNKELGYWVKNQRQFFKKHNLEENRFVLLQNLGFEWKRRIDSVRLSWEDRYKELSFWKLNFGHTLVPQRKGSLGKWVQKQRDLFKKNQLDKEKFIKLKSLEFGWELRKHIEIALDLSYFRYFKKKIIRVFNLSRPRISKCLSFF